jgi:DNA-binding transcriptional regulator YiaG
MLRHWEQARRATEGAARAYLLVIDRDPQGGSEGLAGGMTTGVSL